MPIDQQPEDSLLIHATTLQRQAADPDYSAWVSANAGAGKTRVLIDRISRLLLRGVRPEKILCLTYTKAAAAEMENRLSDRLGTWAMASDEAITKSLFELLGKQPETKDIIRARKLFAQTLEAPGGLKIRTIHAFCESLLGRFPIEANIAPHASVMDDRAAQDLQLTARERVYQQAYRLPNSDLAHALNAMATLVNEDDFGGLISKLLYKREALDKALTHFGGRQGLRGAIYQTVGLLPDMTPNSIIRDACLEGAFDRVSLKDAMDTLLRGSASDVKRAGTLDQWLAATLDEERQNLFSTSYKNLFLKKGNEKRKASGLITKAPREANPKAEESLIAELDRVFHVAEQHKAAMIAENTNHLICLSEALLREYEDIKSHRALLDYDDLILKTLSLLEREGGSGWVHFKLDGGIDHILVDEAQDTSPEQWDVIRHLSDEFFSGEGNRNPNAEDQLDRTIFAVGDEKQSIYSFQGADPAGFLRMRGHFQSRAGAAFNPVQLQQSFRTTSAVLDVVDAVFARTQAQAGVSDENGTRHYAQRRLHAGLVQLLPSTIKTAIIEPLPWDAPVDQASKSSPLVQAAENIATAIAEWLKSGEILQSKNRPIEPGDIMILVRERGQFADEMVKRLKARDVPVAGSDRMTLTDQIAVMDLIASARFTLLPDDDLILATVLKGPFVGLSEDDLFTLAHARTGTLWQALVARAHDNEAPFKQAYEIVSKWLRRADFMPPYEFFSILLGAERGRAALLKRLGPEANDPIDEFLSQCVTFELDHVASLEGFLAWIESGETVIKRDLEAAAGRVRVMTVHGSKGLEANIVILPDTCKAPNKGKLDKVLWTTVAEQETTKVPLWVSSAELSTEQTTTLRDGLHDKALEEYRRLLYVAMTRARDQLYICGWEVGSASKTKDHGRHEDSWYELIRPALEDMDGINIISDDKNPSPTLSFETAQQIEADQEDALQSGIEPAATLPDWVSAPPPSEPEPSQPLSPSKPDQDEPTVMPPFAGDTTARFRRGNLIHRLLQTLPDLPQADQEQAALRWLEASARELPLEAQQALAHETMQVLRHPDFAKIFAPGSMAEVPIAGVVETHEGPKTIAGQVDRLLVTDNCVTIVDYKTNRPPPTREEDVPSIYFRQMALYKAALKHIYQDKEIRCLLVWTDGPRAMELSDEIISTYTP